MAQLKNKIAIQTSGPSQALGLDQAYRLIAEIGFDGVDANVDHLLTYRQIMVEKQHSPAFDGSVKDAVEYFKPWGDAAKKYGIENLQAHAPFHSIVWEEEDSGYNDYLIDVLRKTIYGVESIGCRKLVIHPFHYDYPHQMTPEEEWEINLDRYQRLIPAAKETGVTICLENLFTMRKGKVYKAVCNDPDEAVRYVDALNDLAGGKCFGFCLDVGHALLCGLDIKTFIEKLGNRIACFHLHDNNGIVDQHLAPYTGILDWDRFIEGLRSIKYDGTLNYETFNIWNTVDREMAPEMMRFALKCGQMFSRRAWEQKEN